MTAYDAYLTGRALAEHGLTSDSATHADMDAAADYAGARRPETSDDRHAIRLATTAH